MVEVAIHYFFHCRKFTMETQVFYDTVRVFQPLNIEMNLCGYYNLNMENNIVLVLNPITVYSYGFLFNCTTVGQASDSMTALT